MGRAQKATKEKYAQLSAAKNNIVIDGTGAASKPLLKKKQELESLWKSQKPLEGFSDTLVVRDGSGSMYWNQVNDIMPSDIAEYGRWDDYVYLYHYIKSKVISDKIAKIIIEQFTDDVSNWLVGKPISLLAKWLPSSGASNKLVKAEANEMRKLFNLTPKQYRCYLHQLRKYLNLVEINIGENKWGQINYTEVPSKANIRYKNAFLRHDNERRLKYLDDLKQGKTKINANSLFLYDIVKSARIS